MTISLGAGAISAFTHFFVLPTFGRGVEPVIEKMFGQLVDERIQVLSPSKP
ncbi:MAG: hypothetical protein RR995_04615 [Hungatella sp.]